MKPFSFLHAADLHLDTPFQNISVYPTEIGQILLQASLDSFGRLVEFACRKQVDFVILAGDIYDGEDAGARAQYYFRDGVRTLCDSGITVFIMTGNHDQVSKKTGKGFSLIKDWPTGAHFFPSDKPEAFQLYANGSVLGSIIGKSYSETDVGSDIVSSYKSLLSELPVKEQEDEPGLVDGALRIAVYHGQVSSSLPSKLAYSAVSIDHLTSASFDYWALGHLHQFEILRAGNPYIVYPGTPQGRSLKNSECGLKGAVLVNGQGSKIHDLSFIPLSRFVFFNDELSAPELFSQTELIEVLVAHVRDEILPTLNEPLKKHSPVGASGALNSQDLLVCLRLTVHIEPEIAVSLTNFQNYREFEKTLQEILIREHNIFLTETRLLPLKRSDSKFVSEIVDLAQEVLDELSLDSNTIEDLFKDERKLISNLSPMPFDELSKLSIDEIRLVLGCREYVEANDSAIEVAGVDD